MTTRGLTGGVGAGRGLVRGVVVVSLLLLVGLGAKPAEAAAASGTGAVEAGSSNWRQVSAGLRHTCAIRPSGRLYCWGWDGWGQLGDGGANSNASTPVEVSGGATDWATVTAGDQHTCAVKTTGRLYCWGSDGAGRLGNGGPNTPASTPVEVAGGATDWATVDAGRAHTCATRTSGPLYCWGWDQFGQLGNGRPNRDRSVPVKVAGGVTNWTSVATGSNHSCAVRTNGRAYCWGNASLGQLGNGVTAGPRYLPRSYRPVEVAGRATNWARVAAGSNHTCAVRTNGRLYCWGSDSSGELGDGRPRAVRARPVQVFGGFTNWASVSAGGERRAVNAHTCAIKTTGRLYCWGSNGGGQLGTGPPNTSRFLPAQVPAP